uniref:Peptidase S1 domain-containing protein n=1 Tax=Chinchilla lanigera TaxID=34839 RepID=A0A8C2V2S7_CHILA
MEGGVQFPAKGRGLGQHRSSTRAGAGSWGERSFIRLLREVLQSQACHLSLDVSVSMWFLVLCLVPSLGRTGAAPPVQSRIVGGWECEKHSQPWQVAVYHNGLAVCGGVLVHPLWVLTAAHCLRSDSRVLLGRHNLFQGEDTAQQVHISRSLPHPLYNMSHLWNGTLGRETDLSHDLMLLRLSESANITDAVKVLDLPRVEPEPGSTCFASGWGSIEPEVDRFVLPRTLQCVDLSLLSRDVCARAYATPVTEFMLCAGHVKGGKDACVGDSGGPLICNGVLQGLTSWGSNPCGQPEKPALYTKLVSYRKWIKDTMAANP